MSLPRAPIFAFTASVILFAVACSEPPPEASFGARGSDPSGGNAASGSGSNGSSSGAGSGSSGASSSGGGQTGTGSGSGSGGTTGSSGSTDGGPLSPPPSQPPARGGFQLTIAPLLDQNGCTECHHHGRPIDLTTYPFMSGSSSDAAQALVTAFTKDMPPAPRPAVPQSVITQVNAWVSAGMLP